MQVSELARQLYQAILEKGYTSPEHAWEGADIFNELHITNGNCYDWLRELRKAGMVVHIPANSIKGGDKFYAVPPESFVPASRDTDEAARQLSASIEAIEHISPHATLGIHRGKGDVSQNIDWTKWGTVFGALSVLVAILIAVLS